MKTIFITIFEGVESKNILRTDILTILLANPEVRLVLFAKNKKRIAYFQKEFNHPRIVYEMVEKPNVAGFDWMFSKLKYVLLKSPTTDLRRRMAYGTGGSYFAYRWGFFVNRVLARPSVCRVARMLDYYLVRVRVYEDYFKQYKPNLVFLANLFDEREVHFLREAKRQNVRTIGFINTWDRVSGRCILRLLPDDFVVFNNFVKEELIRHDDVSVSKIFVGGIPQYDQYFSLVSSSRESFFSARGLDPATRLIVYSPIGAVFSNSDWGIIDLLEDLSKKGRFGEKVKVLVRFPPNDFIEEKELKKRPELLYDYPGTRFSEKRGVDWDMDSGELKHLSETLYHMSLLICYASSISIDAVVFDKPVINIDFELGGISVLAKSPTQFYQMEHYRQALRTGGICLVDSIEDLVSAVKKYLDNPALDQEGRKKLVEEQCVFTDGKSGERIGDFVLSHL